jgi:hypothetical protein
MNNDSRLVRLKRRAAELEQELEQRARARMTPSERQAASLGFPPPAESAEDDPDRSSASEKQAAQMRRAVQR